MKNCASLDDTELRLAHARIEAAKKTSGRDLDSGPAPVYLRH